ncbi:hypothetical protein AUR04nite_08370 [Glutamicibacter uratoxydans]|uniref:Lipoprotein n=1 Tax=Glutamicibacter uratoxydans TaxID=43667 RepID=A0A4Y4DNS1_GLUUR|nr:hypothetical protein [Glutamicibacter uratoxydans]GED05305.1 hypothetical protein AUR04nite_08370 [Glutamicibacter uratoxydans]
MRARILAAAVMAVLPLASCVEVQFEPGPRTAPAVAPSEARRLHNEQEQQLQGQEWADQIRWDYELAAEDYLIEDLTSGFYDRQLIAWGASDVGHLEVSVPQSSAEDAYEDLDWMAATLLERLDASVRSVTITVQGEQATGYATRDLGS